jgi:hypothetical protein
MKISSKYKEITDTINDAQERGSDIVSFVDNMITSLESSEIIAEDIHRQRLEAQITSTSNNLTNRNVSYTTQMKTFVGDLQKYITEQYGSVDTFLSDNKIKVKSTFAAISEDVGYTILPTNISDVS